MVSNRRTTRLVLAVVGLVQAVFVGLNLWAPGWDLVDLDQEQNLPTYFQAALLGATALAALDALRLEARLLAHAGRPRRWAALGWLGVVGLFGFLALDEGLQIHERFNTDTLQAGLKPGSPLQGTVVWLIFLLPAMIGAVGWLLTWLGARARTSPALVWWSGAGICLWLVALVLEGTAKAYFIPRDLYAFEVILEETAETLGSALLLTGVWRYRAEMRARLAGPLDLPSLAVPWRRVAVVGVAALVLPAAIVGTTLGVNPAVRLKSVGDDHFRAGRLEDAEQAYQVALAQAPRWGRLWDRLGVARFHRGDLQGADEAFAAASGLDPDSSTPLNHQGAVRFRQGRLGEAVALFSQAADVNPNNADAHRNLGLALRRLGRAAEAEAAFQRAEALGVSRLTIRSLQVTVPADLSLIYIQDPRLAAALHYTRAGRIDAAISEYDRAAAEIPDSPAAHLGLGNELLRSLVARRLGRAPRSVRVWDVDIEPVRSSVVFTHWIQRPDGRWDEVEATIGPQAMDGLASRTPSEAAAHYDRALALGAGAFAHLGLAWLAREQGRSEAAAAHLAMARRLAPSLPGLTNR